MLSKKQGYVAKIPDQNDFVSYTDEEHAIWSELIHRQMAILNERACDAYLEGFELLQLPLERIPQCFELNRILTKKTNWILKPVSAVMPVEEFFSFLANRSFPVATFIRRREDLDYVDEPDIFHEVVGHCPLLLNTDFANFMQAYGQLALKAAPELRKLLGRLFFFTVETGLIETPQGLRIYGSGILSSKDESLYALESSIPERRPFNLSEVLRTTYGLLEMQKIYYVIANFKTLYQLIETDFTCYLGEDMEFGPKAK